MKLPTHVLLFAIIAILFGACRYDDGPAGKPSREIDPKILGTWKDDSVPDHTVTISHSDKYHYKVVIKTTKPLFYETLEFAAFNFKIGSVDTVVAKLVAPPMFTKRKTFDFYACTNDGPDRLVLMRVNQAVARYDAKNWESLSNQIASATGQTNLFVVYTTARRIGKTK